MEAAVTSFVAAATRVPGRQAESTRARASASAARTPPPAAAPHLGQRRWELQAIGALALEAGLGPELQAAGGSESSRILGVGIAIPTGPRPSARWVRRSRRSAA